LLKESHVDAEAPKPTFDHVLNMEKENQSCLIKSIQKRPSTRSKRAFYFYKSSLVGYTLL
jgi:hypothetical protein